jgi:hypothetical protein
MTHAIIKYLDRGSTTEYEHGEADKVLVKAGIKVTGLIASHKRLIRSVAMAGHYKNMVDDLIILIGGPDVVRALVKARFGE